MNNAPRTIDEYLLQLRRALKGADPAVVQDALYDAEEHLRVEMLQNRDKTEAEVIGPIVESYGSPEEIAEIYLEDETRIRRAIGSGERTRLAGAEGPLRRYFNVLTEPRAYAAVFYMMLALITGVVYFTVTVTGLSLSIGLAITIIGVPLFLVVLAVVRTLALVEGRFVELCYGVRMPRRPRRAPREDNIWGRVREVLKDGRTWSSILYMLLQLPLGVLYFTVVVTLVAVSLTAIASPVLGAFEEIQMSIGPWQDMPWILTPFLAAIGVFLLPVAFWFAMGAGWLHARLARLLLVQWGSNGGGDVEAHTGVAGRS